MQDLIYGIADSIIDGDTFILKVTETGESNQNNYSKWERVRIKSLDASELGALRGLRNKINLEKALQGKNVSCSVQTKDTNGRVVADVKIV